VVGKPSSRQSAVAGSSAQTTDQQFRINPALAAFW